MASIIRGGVVVMWVYTKHGFLAIVQHNSMPEHFQVKSRIIDPLEILWPDEEIEIIDWADYRFRITITKEKTIQVVTEQLSNVDYTSFKDECKYDEEYYYTLTKVWSIMYNYQQRMES
jgi:hypothetical protein|tara:strand:+ start:266 stop:619 length:354 start_codon:yes stop_codon:yes gene_type:complete